MSESEGCDTPRPLTHDKLDLREIHMTADESAALKSRYGHYVTEVSKEQLEQMLSKDTEPTPGLDTILKRRFIGEH